MLNRRAQSTLEYAIIIAVVMAGLWLMQNYVKRGFQGKMKESTDQIGEQYDPAAYTGHYTLDSNSTVVQTNFERAQQTNYTHQVNTKNGTEALAAWDANASVYNQPVP